jgi:peptidoglycan/xylan/chitin deacetylase (PgdA/CDA1 family)
MFYSRSIVLLYHRVANIQPDRWSLCVSPQHFAEHLEVLQKFRRVRLDQLKPGGWSLRPQRTVVITFDDGYADNLHEAAPLLRRFDTAATFFIATGYIGGMREFWWDELERVVPQDEYLSYYERMQPLEHSERRRLLDAKDNGALPGRASHLPLTMDELQTLAADELFEIGAHTVTHPLLAAQAPLEQRREISGSKVWLETVLHRPVTSFSYPYGGTHHYTPATVNAVRELGFSRACTTTARSILPSDDPYRWGRINVTDMGGEEFERLLSA